MNVKTASARIGSALEKLDAAVGETVFDEWALVGSDPKVWKLFSYRGPRKEEFISEFKSDMNALRETLDLSNALVGDFAFSHEGHGSGFDAHICAGEGVFILFNNTEKNTTEIVSNPKWRPAQIHFSNLLEAFISDPVTA
jgi:hypothetical protein